MYWYRLAPLTRHRASLVVSIITLAGVLGFAVGYWYGQYTYIPLSEQSYQTIEE